MVTTKLTSPGELFQQTRLNIEVPDNTQRLLGTEQDLIHVELKTFTDLQAVGLISRQLEEQAVRQAIRQDDAAALQLSQAQLQNGDLPAHDCSCHAQEQAQTAKLNSQQTRRTQLRSLYSSVRKTAHPALAQVMSDASRAHLDYDSLEVTQTHGFLSRLSATRLIIIASVLVDDITIGRNATLKVAAAAKLLFARKIQIFRGGLLHAQGSFLRVKCSSIQGGLLALNLHDIAHLETDIQGVIK